MRSVPCLSFNIQGGEYWFELNKLKFRLPHALLDCIYKSSVKLQISMGVQYLYSSTNALNNVVVSKYILLKESANFVPP